MVKKIILAILFLIIINQVKIYVHNFAYANPNNIAVVIATFFLSIALSIVLVLTLGKLLSHKNWRK